MLDSYTPYQPKDPGDGSKDGNGKWKPKCCDGKKRIKYECKISELPALADSFQCFFTFI